MNFFILHFSYICVIIKYKTAIIILYIYHIYVGLSLELGTYTEPSRELAIVVMY